MYTHFTRSIRWRCVFYFIFSPHFFLFFGFLSNDFEVVGGCCCCWIFAVYFLDIKTSVYILFPLARLVVAGDPIRSDPLPTLGSQPMLGCWAFLRCCRRLVFDTRQSLFIFIFDFSLYYFLFFLPVSVPGRFLVASFFCSLRLTGLVVSLLFFGWLKQKQN